MNKNLKRIAALLLAIAMIASFAACKNDKNNNDTTAAGDVAINGDAIADDLLPEASSEAASDDTAVETEIVTDKEGHTVIETKAPADNSAKPSNGKPESYAEILAAYRDVLNLAKSSKVGYEKSEWQTLPKDKRNFDGFVINAALPVAELFMTSEKDAKGKKHENNPKGTDMKWFPIYQHPTKGCTLTDVSKIKSAKCEVLSNGNYKKSAVEIPATGTPSEPGKPTGPDFPQTGDNSDMILWIALLYISGGVLTGVMVFDKRKRHSVK